MEIWGDPHNVDLRGVKILLHVIEVPGAILQAGCGYHGPTQPISSLGQ